jgi:ABC-2 type transport system permease protein
MTPGVDVVVGESAASDPKAVRQWLALNDRFVTTMGRHYEFVLCVLAPVLLTVCFYLPLRKVMNIFAGIDYAQFLMPIICLQSASFIATSAAMRAAMDETLGITKRLRSMPVNPFVPQLSRLSSNTVLLIVSLTAAMASGLVIGWRPQSGALNLVGFLVVAVVVGMVFAFGADVIGTLTKSPESTSQAMALPTLILGMLSTGFVPEDHFPEWIQPFARNQPVSQFADAMRAFDEGTISFGILFPTLCWVGGLIAVSLAVGLTLMVRSARS